MLRKHMLVSLNLCVGTLSVALHADYVTGHVLCNFMLSTILTHSCTQLHSMSDAG